MRRLHAEALLCAVVLLAVTARVAADADGDPATGGPDPLPCNLCPPPTGGLVCSTSGKLFKSECRVTCTGEAVRGECGQRTEDQCRQSCESAAKPLQETPGISCSTAYEPVCSTRGRVFGNACVATSQFGVAVRFSCGKSSDKACIKLCFDATADPQQPSPDPPAPPSCTCDKSLFLVCGKSGAVHDNACIAEECWKDPILRDCSSFAGIPPFDDGMGPATKVVSRPASRIFIDRPRCEALCQQEVAAASCQERCDLNDTQLTCSTDGSVYPAGKLCLAGCTQQQPATAYGCRDKRLSDDECKEQCAADAGAGGGGDDDDDDGGGGIVCECSQTSDRVVSPVCGRGGKVYDCAQQAECYQDPARPEVNCTEMGREECELVCWDAANPPCASCPRPSTPYPPGASPPPPSPHACRPPCAHAVCGESGSTYECDALRECSSDRPREGVDCTGLSREDCDKRCYAAANPCATCPYTLVAAPPVCALNGRVYDCVQQLECYGTDRNPSVECSLSTTSDTTDDCPHRCREAAVFPRPPNHCNCPITDAQDVCTASGRVVSRCHLRCSSLQTRFDCGDRTDCRSDCLEAAIVEEERVTDDGTGGADGGKNKGNCTCDASYSPVCGTNGVVYSNLCELECVADNLGVSFLFSCVNEAGKVRPTCKQDCRPRIMPVKGNGPSCAHCQALSAGAEVCGTNGTVHRHECFAQCKKDPVRWPCRGRLDCAGKCAAAATAERTLPGGCSCVEIHAPVCAASGRVQPNSCTALCKGDEPWFECGPKLTPGQCTAACVAALRAAKPIRLQAGMAASCKCGSAPAKPACATSGTVYHSQCLLTCAKASKRWDCDARKDCPADCLLAAAASMSSVCTAGTKAVCATSGQVSANPCALKAAKLTKRWDCDTRKNCANDCAEAAKPPCPKAGPGLCATSGKLYPNDCLLKKAKATLRWACGTRRQCAKECTAAAKPAVAACPKTGQVVCATNGTVYPNDCLLQRAKATLRWACGKRGAKCAKLCRAARSRR